jgi:integrase
VFVSEVGTQLDAANVRRAFRKVAKATGLAAEDWTPRELRHSFVSLLSSQGVPIEDIAALAGHVSTVVTEKSTGTSCGRCSEPGRRRWTRSFLICSSRRLSLPGHARGRFPERETGL